MAWILKRDKENTGYPIRAYGRKDLEVNFYHVFHHKFKSQISAKSALVNYLKIRFSDDFSRILPNQRCISYYNNAFMYLELFI
jgi:hypothetical protein